jgi:hypothetical protein
MVSRNSGRKLDTDEPKNGKTTIKFSTRVLSQAPNDLITAASSWDSRPLTIIALHTQIQGLASRIMLNGVSVARRMVENPP